MAGSPHAHQYLHLAFYTLPGSSMLDVAIVLKGKEDLLRPSNDFKALDYGQAGYDVVCEKSRVQVYRSVTYVALGPCNQLQPNEEYAVVAHVSRYGGCACPLPCRCTGDMSKTLSTQAGSGYEATEGGKYFVPPDVSSPTMDLTCEEGCASPTSVEVTLKTTDFGKHYPVLALCAACRTNALGLNVCIRPGDSIPRRYWRLWAADNSGAGCSVTGGQPGITVSEVLFYIASNLTADGTLLVGATPFGGGTTLEKQNPRDAFDAVNSTAYTWSTVPINRSYLGIDLGLGNEATVLHAYVRWNDTQCRPTLINLEGSDDLVTWTARAAVPVNMSANDTEVLARGPPPLEAGWRGGTYFQAAYIGEGVHTMKIDGLTPNVEYNMYCYSEDSVGNNAVVGPVPVTTTDAFAPNITLHGLSATDFSVRPRISLVDVGKSYPALSACIARWVPNGSVMSGPTTRRGINQLCHTVNVPNAPAVEPLRIPYVPVIESWLQDEVNEVHVQQNAWAGTRQELRSCGLRHEPAYGRGGCRAAGSRTQPAEFHVLVKAPMDAWVFLGEAGRGGMGYEIQFGGGTNRRTTLRKGHSSGTINQDLGRAGILRQLYFKLDRYKYTAFWVSADPVSGMVRVGLGATFHMDVILEYEDPVPLKNIDSVYVGAGGSAQDYFADEVAGSFIVCPKTLNLALHKRAHSSSVAFGGVAEKAVDGVLGDGTFCSYCRPDDYRHVCAGTKRGTVDSPPWVRVDLDKEFLIGPIRLVVPTDGREEQRKNWRILVGKNGDETDRRCLDIPDAGGDNFWECDSRKSGRYVSVYANGAALEGLPSDFGMRICELEVYEEVHQSDNDIRRFEHPMGHAEPEQLQPGENTDPVEVEIGGLQPNETYEVMCYAEDANGFWSNSSTEVITTTDTTPPRVIMQDVRASDHNISVNVSVYDPGHSYPVKARCAVTTGGTTPQEHERFFEHRFWRAHFLDAATSLDQECDNKLYLRGVELLTYAGAPLPGKAFGPWESYNIEEDADLDSYGDTTESFLWTLDASKPWVAVDTAWVSPLEEVVRLNGGAVRGDIILSVTWEPWQPLEMMITVPDTNGFLMGINSTRSGGVFDVSCTLVECDPPVESASFALAEVGYYEVRLWRKGSYTTTTTSVTTTTTTTTSETTVTTTTTVTTSTTATTSTSSTATTTTVTTTTSADPNLTMNGSFNESENGTWTYTPTTTTTSTSSTSSTTSTTTTTSTSATTSTSTSATTTTTTSTSSTSTTTTSTSATTATTSTTTSSTTLPWETTTATFLIRICGKLEERTFVMENFTNSILLASFNFETTGCSRSTTAKKRPAWQSSRLKQPPPPFGYDAPWRTHGQFSYVLAADKPYNTYKDAKGACSALDNKDASLPFRDTLYRSSLLQIDSADENDFVNRSICKNSCCWLDLEEIGGSSVTNKSMQSWRWAASQHEVQYPGWAELQPRNDNGVDERNAVMLPNGTWDDVVDGLRSCYPYCRREEQEWTQFGSGVYTFAPLGGRLASSHTAAIGACEDLGPGISLARIDSYLQNEFIRSTYCGTACCWIGFVEVFGDVSTAPVDQVWVWEGLGKQRNPMWTNWQIGEPSNRNEIDGRYAAMDPEGRWLALPSRFGACFAVCQKNEGTCDWSSATVVENRRCSIVLWEETSYSAPEATTRCDADAECRGLMWLKEVDQDGRVAKKGHYQGCGGYVAISTSLTWNTYTKPRGCESRFYQAPLGTPCLNGTALVNKSDCSAAASGAGMTQSTVTHDGTFEFLPAGCSLRIGGPELVWNSGDGSGTQPMDAGYFSFCRVRAPEYVVRSPQCCATEPCIYEPITAIEDCTAALAVVSTLTASSVSPDNCVADQPHGCYITGSGSRVFMQKPGCGSTSLVGLNAQVATSGGSVCKLKNDNPSRRLAENAAPRAPVRHRADITAEQKGSVVSDGDFTTCTETSGEGNVKVTFMVSASEPSWMPGVPIRLFAGKYRVTAEGTTTSEFLTYDANGHPGGYSLGFGHPLLSLFAAIELPCEKYEVPCGVYVGKDGVIDVVETTDVFFKIADSETSDNKGALQVTVHSLRSRTEDSNPWWRVDLGSLQRVEAFWLVGSGTSDGSAAAFADVWVVEPEHTDPSHGKLCMSNAPIYDNAAAVAGDTSGISALQCDPGAAGSHLWIVASPKGQALSLCEIELFLSPPATASDIKVQYANFSHTICGTPKVAVEWSDDNISWNYLWEAPTNVSSLEVSSGSWSWWSRFFAMPFSTTFDHASVRTIMIPSLRENSTYDVFCWGADNAGNDISRALVEMDVPWATTHVIQDTEPGFATQYGTRRLSEVSFAELRELSAVQTGPALRCTEELRALISCEESIVTTDTQPPEILMSEFLRAHSADPTASGDADRATWILQLRDTSCNGRRDSSTVVRCVVRCAVEEEKKAGVHWNPLKDEVSSSLSSCVRPLCVESPWSNGIPALVEFTHLRADFIEYAVICAAFDPWGNRALSPRSSFRTLEAPATPMPVYAPRNPPPPAPPSTFTYEEVPDLGKQPLMDFPSPTGNDDAGWTAVGRANYGNKDKSVAPTPRPTEEIPPEYIASVDPIVKRKPTSTTTTWLAMPEGPQRLEFVVSIGASTKEEVDLLRRPSAADGVVEALRTVLGLSPDDEVRVLQIVSTKVNDVQDAKAANRRLNASSKSLPSNSSKGDSGSWKVKVQLAFRLTGHAQSAIVLKRFRKLEDALSSASWTSDFSPSGLAAELVQQLEEEFSLRGLDIAPQSLGVVMVDDGSDPFATTTTTTLHVISVAVRHEGEASDQASSSDDAYIEVAGVRAPVWMFVSAAAVVSLLLCFALGAIGCAMVKGHRKRAKPRSRPSAVADATLATDPSIASADVSDLRPLALQASSQERRPERVREVLREAHSPKVPPPTLAWSPHSKEEEGSRACTPLSACSTSAGTLSQPSSRPSTREGAEGAPGSTYNRRRAGRSGGSHGGSRGEDAAEGRRDARVVVREI
eukprot:TRINITY_DN16357_c0_g5_i1.p1 TRINITY_DN16357_c0_g5~~TRINITY_DN16357_c0_g5_i1.p1  ORF type:complete len:3496 (-),score=386.76 TRINITY_DN16357_c0_g5_i1:147-9086(-)